MSDPLSDRIRTRMLAEFQSGGVRVNARRMGLDPMTLWRFAQGGKPSAETLDAVAAFLDAGGVPYYPSPSTGDDRLREAAQRLYVEASETFPDDWISDESSMAMSVTVRGRTLHALRAALSTGAPDTEEPDPSGCAECGLPADYHPRPENAANYGHAFQPRAGAES
jgi:transcriptional regulator with XRE-family HTH domain